MTLLKNSSVSDFELVEIHDHSQGNENSNESSNKIDVSEIVSGYLSSLSSTEKAELVIRHCQEEFSEIFTRSEQKGYDKGYSSGVEVAQREYQVVEQKLLDSIQSWNTLVNDISSHKFESALDSNTIIVMVFEAVSEMFKYLIIDENFPVKIIHNILDKYKTKSIESITLSKVHYNQLMKFYSERSENPPLTILYSDDVDVGGYQIGLSEGVVEYDPVSILEQLKQYIQKYS